MRRSAAEETWLDGVKGLAAGKVVGAMMEWVIELDLFTKLAGRSWSVAELASLLGLPSLSARMVAQFLCREGLLVYGGGRLSNAPVVEAFLTSGESNDLQHVRKLARLTVPTQALAQRLRQPPARHKTRPRPGHMQLGRQQHTLPGHGSPRGGGHRRVSHQ